MNTDELWQAIENQMLCTVPKYIQNLLRSQGFDNIIAIKNMDADDIRHLESFAKSKEYLKKVPKDANLIDYLGTYYDDQTNFEILRGHKKMLLEIVLRFSKEYKDGTLSFFAKSSKQQMVELHTGMEGQKINQLQVIVENDSQVGKYRVSKKKKASSIWYWKIIDL